MTGFTKYAREVSEDDNVPLIHPDWPGHSRGLFQCENCKGTRVFGFGKPERMRYMLLCGGTCGKHTWHIFVKVY